MKMTTRRLDRLTAYRIDPLLAASVEEVEFNPRDFAGNPRTNDEVVRLRKGRQAQRTKHGWMILPFVLIAMIAPFTTTDTSSAAVAHVDSDTRVRAIQQRLVDFGYTIVVDGVSGPQTLRAVRHFQRANGLEPDGVVGPLTLAALNIDGPVTATAPAVRLTPPIAGLGNAPFAPEGLDECAEMNFYREQWGLPARFDDSGRHQRWTPSDGIGWRESKCQNDVNTSCCWGYWQLNIGLFFGDWRMAPRLAACGVASHRDVSGTSPLAKQKQACAAAMLYQLSGLSPWSPT